MGGWFNGLGNFLGGYAQARRQKQIDKSNEHQQMMDQAQQWANIADRASGPGGDAIREMATKNMQDMIVNYEKSAGEKQGLGAIIKMFGGGEKDAAPILNKIAPLLSQRPEPQMAQASGLQDNTQRQWTDEEMQMTSLPNPADQPTGEEAMRQAAGAMPESAPIESGQQQPSFNTVSDQAISAASAGTPSGINAPADAYAGNKGAVERFQKIAQNLAPGRSAFAPQYSGGSRYSPTYSEIQANELASKKNEYELKSKEELANAERIADAAEKRHQIKIEKDIESVRQTPAYVNATQPVRDRMEYGIRFGQPPPGATPEDKELSGAVYVKGNEIWGKTKDGTELVQTQAWKAANPSAGTFFDLQPANKKDIDAALREGAAYERDKQKLGLLTQKAQIDRFRNMSKNELQQILTQGRLIMKDGRASAQRMLDSVDKQWNDHIKSMTPPIGVSMDEFITGKKNGMPSTRVKTPQTDDMGRPFESAQEYEDYWKSKQLPVPINQVRQFVVDGVMDDMEFASNMLSGDTMNDAFKKSRKQEGGPTGATGSAAAASTAKTVSGPTASGPSKPSTLPAPPAIAKTSPFWSKVKGVFTPISDEEFNKRLAKEQKEREAFNKKLADDKKAREDQEKKTKAAPNKTSAKEKAANSLGL